MSQFYATVKAIESLVRKIFYSFKLCALYEIIVTKSKSLTAANLYKCAVVLYMYH